MLNFAHAWILWLAPLPLLVWRLAPAWIRPRPAVRVPFLSRLLDAGGQASDESSRGRMTWAVRWVVWLLLLLAVARPEWLEPPIERVLPARDLLLLVDLSGSMEHEDFTSASGETVDRLTAVKEVLGDFLVQREGDRVGLVVFGTSPFLQAPFTTDLPLCRQLLDETAVRMAGPRTALGDAIGLSIKLFEESDAPTRTIIVLTDGNDTSSSVAPIEAAKVARDRGITIHTIAIGDPTTVGEEAIDEQALRTVSQSTRGEYFLAMNRQELQGVYQRLDEVETREVQTISHRPRRDLYFWPLAAALLCTLAARCWRIWEGRPRTTDADRAVRLRVNTRTFELETIDS